MIISAFSFACMGATVKLASEIGVAQKIFFRNVVTALVAFLIAKKTNVSLFGSKKTIKLLIWRSVIGLTAVFMYFWSISRLVLADSTMLNKMFPFFVIIFAGYFLKEKITKKQVLSVLIAFLGALLIIKPGFSLKLLPAFAAFLSAIGAGAAYTLVSHLRHYEKPPTIVFFFAFVCLIGSFPFMLFDFTMPNLSQLIVLLATGLFGVIGQYGLTFAYRLAPAAEISILNYLSIVFSGFLGFVFWQEIPDYLSLLGGILIIFSALFLFVRRRQSKV